MNCLKLSGNSFSASSIALTRAGQRRIALRHAGIQPMAQVLQDQKWDLGQLFARRDTQARCSKTAGRGDQDLGHMPLPLG